MLQATTLDQQLHDVRDDHLRVLVVGAGVAGITISGLLRGQGLHPVLVERAEASADQGYMLALMPLVDPVLDALEVRDAYRARSTPLETYCVRDRLGRVVRKYSLGGLLSRFGDYRGIVRGDLVDVLSGDGLPVTYAVSPTAVDQTDEVARVTLGGTVADFDLVIGADGLHSTVRSLVLADDEVTGVDTGWGGWIAWTGPGQPPARGEEVWGPGYYVGAFPVLDDTGVIVCGPREETSVGPAAFVQRVRDQLAETDGIVGVALEAVESAEEPYYWSLVDRRSARWSVDRVLLLGDAAAGFLPTAGIGACMAMESAGMLADRLRGVGGSGDGVRAALTAYEEAQRPRVESAQSNSRWLAHLVFRESRVIAFVRDQLLRLVSLEIALGPIIRLMKEQPALLGAMRTDDAATTP